MKTLLNTQPISKPLRGNGLDLKVHSIFWTLQGEGPFTGQAAVFLRLAGCNLQCPGCDTEYTAGAGGASIHNILRRVEDERPVDTTGQKLLVITGGEPFRQNIAPFAALAVQHGWHVQVETNGVLPPQEYQTLERLALYRKALTIVVSPKTAKVNDDLTHLAHCFKYVLAADSIREEDGLPLQALGNKCSPYVARPPLYFRGPVYVNPMDAKDPEVNAANLRATAASAMKHGFIMGVQLHKAVGLA